MTGTGAVRPTERLHAAPPWILPLAIGIGAALVAAVLTFGTGGVRLGEDSPRYLDGAASLLEGHGVPRGASPYAGYVVFLAAVTGVGGGLAAIGAVQVVLAGVTAAAVTDVAARRFGPVAGLTAGLLLLAYLDLWRWYGYVLTDALFVTLMTIAVWAVDRATTGRRRYLVAAVVTAAAAAFVRPNGWFLAAAAGVFLSLTARGPLGRRALSAAATVAVVALGWSFTLDTAASHAAPGQMLQDGAVIWGWPPSWIDMPAAPEGKGLVGYVLSNPIASLELGLRRVAIELGQVRPYYSTAHNAVIAVVLVPLYVLAAIGVPRALGSRTGRVIVVAVAAHLAFIAATFADYDGRFMTYVLPLVAVLSGAGAVSVLARLRWGLAVEGGAGPARERR